MWRKYKVQLSKKVRTLLLGTTYLGMVAAPALAQDAADQDAEPRELDKVVVVGSQVVGADIEGALPVTVVDAESFAENGFTSGEDIIRSIPQLGSIGFGAVRGGITGVNAARGDVASFNLRSVGEGNTLVLINGRRSVLHPITQTSSFDGVPITTTNANSLPPGAIDRVEILRDGAAALYGADAVAGVINYVLDDDYTGGEISVRGGKELDDGGRSDLNITGSKGFEFNDGRTNLVLSGSFSTRNGILAQQSGFNTSEDLRGRAPSEFASDISLDNRSSLEVTPFFNLNGIGTFHLRPVDLVRDNGSTLGVGDCGGRGFAGSDLVLNDGIQDLCIDSGGHDRALRPNRLSDRTLIPDTDRLNIFTFGKHELSDTMELYGEASYYYAKTDRQWEQASILSNGRFFVPADYYYNPFGPVTFADGRTNPNRLPGLDTSLVPEEGLGFELLSLRPVDVGPRQIEVTNESFRVLGGVRGEWGNWNYDSAFLYSEATAEDVSNNRISTPLLQASLSLDTPNAYNIFTGVNPGDPSSITDLTVNPRSAIDPFIVSSSREAETTLTLIDFKLSNASIFELPAGGVGIAVGAEFRREELDEDNSAIFDGSQPFIDPLDTSLAPGEVTNLSSLQGSSVRPDFGGERDVYSAYGELLVPLLADLPLIQSLDAQFAVRFEDFSQFGSVTKPKVALSWYPIDWLQVRAAYSEGFRAPSLVQLNLPDTSITTGVQDFAEGILLGTGDINAGPANGNYILETSGNINLQPEESENFNAGIVFTPTSNFTFTADYWSIEAVGTVGVLSDENESRLDAVLRAQGSSNPSVTRAAPDADNPLGEIILIQRGFENLGQRELEGIDLAVFYDLETDIGNFGFEVNAAKLNKFDQSPSGIAQQIVDFGADPTVLGSAVGSALEVEFFPEWRGSGRITWDSPDDKWGASLFGSYVGEVIEPSVTDSDGNFYTVEEDIRFNASVVRRDLFGDDSSLRIGVNNILDEDPPLADESFGYEGELHSVTGRYVFVSFTKQFN